MGNNRQEEVSKAFFLENLISRVMNVKKRLDYLIFILLMITCFGLYFMKQVPKDFIFFKLDSINASVYHGVMAGVLLIIFGIIGSHLIEYIIKRKLIDKELQEESFFKGKRWREEQKKMDVKEGDEKYMIISSMIAPSSFYEFFYTLDLTRKNLRAIAPIVLGLSFFLSQAVAYFHVIQVEAPRVISEGFGILLFIGYLLLYCQFLSSLRDNKKRLYDSIIKPLGCFFILYILSIIVIRVVL
ncbi:hypothetical protein [Kordia zhangzhouensis]|uniref:hypothetical protein n=1 Tax=Kordia zhangzhouensis TaxID=1620405 RepID=UPI0006299F88|nr:hypothetical protein [Kordia zhangzhouensis]